MGATMDLKQCDSLTHRLIYGTVIVTYDKQDRVS